MELFLLLLPFPGQERQAVGKVRDLGRKYQKYQQAQKINNRGPFQREGNSPWQWGQVLGSWGGRETAREIRDLEKKKSQWSRDRKVQGTGLILHAIYR